jgi:hypothetical protein
VDAKLAPVNAEHEIVYADRSTDDEQLSVTPLVRKIKTTNMVGG